MHAPPLPLLVLFLFERGVDGTAALGLEVGTLNLELLPLRAFPAAGLTLPAHIVALSPLPKQSSTEVR